MHVVDADIVVFLMILVAVPPVMFVVGLVPLELQSFVLPWFIICDEFVNGCLFKVSAYQLSTNSIIDATQDVYKG